MNAEIIAVGSELLTPHRLDTNSLWLTEKLNSLGIPVVLKTVVGDDRARLKSVLAEALGRSDLILTIGGLGPTEDDVTREAVAELLGRRLARNEEIVRRMEARFRARGMAMPEINLRQAMVPEGALILENDQGTAPGLWLEERGKHIMLLPGPPHELKPMFERDCLPRLANLAPPRVLRTRVYRLTGLTESETETRVAPIHKQYTNPQTTILAAPGEIQIHLTATGQNEAEANEALVRLGRPIESTLGDLIFSKSGESLEEVVGQLLLDRQATLAVAESCTGGMLAERITRVAGSSAYFLGGAVCYSNELKTALADVPSELIAQHGAVSAEVARALAEGIRRCTGATLGASITGIAGPTGATPAKPVGLVYIGLASSEVCQHREFHFLGDRDRIRWQATQAALDWIRRWLER